MLAQLRMTCLLELAGSHGVSRRARENLTTSAGDAKLCGQSSERDRGALDEGVAEVGRAGKVDADVEEVERRRDGLAQDGGDLGARQAIRQAAGSERAREDDALLEHDRRARLGAALDGREVDLE